MFGSNIFIKLFVIAFPITENMFGSYICIELFVIAFPITENVIYEIKSSCKEGYGLFNPFDYSSSTESSMCKSLVIRLNSCKTLRTVSTQHSW